MSKYEVGQEYTCKDGCCSVKVENVFTSSGGKIHINYMNSGNIFTYEECDFSYCYPKLKPAHKKGDWLIGSDNVVYLYESEQNVIRFGGRHPGLGYSTFDWYNSNGVNLTKIEGYDTLKKKIKDILS